MEAEFAAILSFNKVGAEKTQCVPDSAKGKFVPGDFIFGKQPHLKAFGSRVKLKIEQFRAIKQVHLMVGGQVD